MRKLQYDKHGFIVDKIYGKLVVRNCDSNIAKMTVWQCIYYELFHWGGIDWGLIFSQFLEAVKNLCYCAINLLYVLLYPILLPFMARSRIKRAKAEMEQSAIRRGHTIQSRYERIKQQQRGE